MGESSLPPPASAPLETVELVEGGYVVRRGTREIHWRVRHAGGWIAAIEVPQARIEMLDLEPGVVWRRRVELALPRGTSLLRVESAPRSVRRSPLEHLRRGPGGIRRVVRSAFLVGARGRLDPDPQEPPASPPSIPPITRPLSNEFRGLAAKSWPALHSGVDRPFPRSMPPAFAEGGPQQRHDPEPEPPSQATGPSSGLGPMSLEPTSSQSSILLVDDDPMLLRAVARWLATRGYEVVTAGNGAEAVKCLRQRPFDVILSDISMPGMDGIALLHQVREHDLLVPIILITGEPAVRTAVQAIEYGAFHYLTKPVSPEALEEVVKKALRVHRLARVQQQAAELLGNASALGADRAGLEASFDRALEQLWIAYQPIVDLRQGRIFGHEALLRTREESLPHPGAVLDAAARLGRMDELGRTIRVRAAEPVLENPAAGKLFVNLHVTDLIDPMLYAKSSPLTSIADRVVLEITERSSLDSVKDVRSRIATLRDLGFSIAVDDLGAGYAGLTSFTLLEPEIVKLDMSLVRDVHLNRTKQKVVRSMTALAKDMGIIVVAEGLERVEERDTLVGLGCDLFQGFLFARPGPAFPPVSL